MDDLMDKLQSVLNDEDSMNQIRQLADMLSGSSEQSPAPQAPQNDTVPAIDPVKLMQLGQLFQSAANDDDNIRLLIALRPLLREENKPKLDRVIKVYRLLNIYPALKDSLLGGGSILGTL